GFPLSPTGIAISIILIYALLTAKRYKKMLEESIGLQFNNLQLLNELEIEKNHASKLHEEVEDEYKKLKETEESLRKEKKKAEEMASTLLALSSLDGLTSIANRRQFDEMLAREWNRSLRAHAPLSLIMADID